MDKLIEIQVKYNLKKIKKFIINIFGIVFT